MADLESKAAEYVARIVRDETFDLSDPMERATLACFLAVQMVRTRAALETQADLGERMKAWLEGEGTPPGFFDPDPMIGSGENANKASMARMICNAPTDFAPSLIEKDWVLLKADLKHPFIMGDHPFAMFNDEDTGLRGKLGIRVKGIQIYFPLSPTLAIGLWCFSIQPLLLSFVAKMNALSRTHPHVAAQSMREWQHALEAVEAIRLGVPLHYLPANVEHFNSLQVAYSERFVFSDRDDFSLVESMIDGDPSFCRGQRVTEATGKL